ncbi:MAG: rhomboid family intramembrane serine protease [Candidatus Aenigmatarchaeota archaeon]
MAELPLASLVIFLISLAIFLFSLDFPFLIEELSLKADKLLYQPYRILTFQFLHKDLLHIAGNMLFLLAIGLRIEEKIGSIKFFLIFIFSGIFSSLLLFLIQYFLDISLIILGSSGGLFGLLFLAGALAGREEIPAILVPILNVFSLPFYLFLKSPKVPLGIGIIFYLLFQLILFFYNFPNSFGEFGHFGGLLAGFIAFLLLF